jgi:hypothetical protein
MPKTITIINMGSDKSWSGTKSQIWAQLFLDIAAQELKGCRSEDSWNLGKVDPLPTLTTPLGFKTPQNFHYQGALEAWTPADGDGANDYVQLNDGPSGNGVGITKIRNAVNTAMEHMDAGDTVNIVGHSRGGWLAWPQAALIAASRQVQINMFLIDPVRRAFSGTYTGSDAWMSQYSQWGVTMSSTATQQESVAQNVVSLLGNVEIMYMSNTTSSFPKLKPSFATAPNAVHRWVMPGKHGSATNSETNPYLTNFTLWLIQRFLYRNHTAFKPRIRFKGAAALDDAFIQVRVQHQVNNTQLRVWDPGSERIPSVLPDNLSTALLVDEQYNTFPPTPRVGGNANGNTPSVWSTW